MLADRIAGWGVPFLWAGVWAAITVPWVRSAMARERHGWEDDSAIEAGKEEESAPPANAPGPLAEKASEASTLGGHEDDTTETNEKKKTDNVDNAGESAARHSEATTV